MFDRSSNESQKQVLMVRLILMSGEELKGGITTTSRTLKALLNNDENFVEFTDIHGELEFIAKSRIAGAKPIEEIKTDQLSKKKDSLGVMNPWQILDVPNDASPEQIHEAYRAKARSYHPDRLSSLGLPPEMLQYAEAMQLQVNRAYEELKPRPEQEKRHVNQPVFEKKPQAGFNDDAHDARFAKASA